MTTTRSFETAALLGLLLAAGSAAAQEITFFEHDNFSGRRFSADRSVQNMTSAGFNDRASSVAIRYGTWQLCTDAYFRGRCVTLNPGEYRTLASIGLSNQVSSARQVGGSPLPDGGGGGQAGSIVLYEDQNFAGRAVTINDGIANLGRTDFNDRARSMIVSNGTWELCRDDEYRGGCQTYNPGRYGNLGSLSGEVSSIRQVGGGNVGMPAPAPGGYWPDNWGGQSRVILYEGTNLSGRGIAANDYMPNLASTGFNDRAASLRVEQGYWMFCSDANFQGTCRTFGPGDYPTLPAGLSNRISSGRRISNDYPYNNNPNWSGYTQQ